MMTTRSLQRIILPAVRRWSKTLSTSTSSVTSTKITVSEFKIPFGDGNYIAGKLWKGNDDSTSRGVKIDPIICLHGWLDNACSFDPLLPLIIKPNMTAIALDFPGHGLSSHYNCSSYDLLDASAIIHRAFRHFGYEKAILMGHSMGSVLSFVFVGAFPEMVSGYIAIDNVRPIPRGPVNTVRNFTRKLFEVESKLALKLPPPAYTYEEIIERSYVGRGKSITRDGCKILLNRGATQRPDGKYSFTHDLRVTVPTAAGRFTVEQSQVIASAIKCKVCIIKGDPGMDYEPREEFLKVVEEIRKSSKEKVEFHLVPGTHHLHLNTPELVAPIISNFLSS